MLRRALPLTLLVLVCLISVAKAAKIDCRRFALHPYCKGISAKRAQLSEKTEEFRLPPIPDESFEEFKDRQLVRFLETQMPRAVAANDNDNNNNNNNPKAGGYQNPQQQQQQLDMSPARPRIVYLAAHVLRPKVMLPAKEVYNGNNNNNNFIEVYNRPRVKFVRREHEHPAVRGIGRRNDGGGGNFGYGYDLSR